MPNMPGDTFVSKGIKYVLQNGPKGNLRPYTLGPVSHHPLWVSASLVAAGVLLVAGFVAAAMDDDSG